ncbi:MAG: hypothetical protein FJ388_13175, partial [Verrucomicrobia bacterium]|nr:hypothetical protein [Verrucomicrobiota bacterium]
MNKVPTLIALLCLIGNLLADSDDNGRAFYIQWSIKETQKRADWSGRAEVSVGKIVNVEKDSGPADSVREDGSWEIIYGRGLDGTPAKKPGTPRKGVLLTIQAADDAVVTVRTQSGEFSFRAGEVTKEGIERLDGNVRVSLGRPDFLMATKAGKGDSGKRRKKGATATEGTPTDGATDLGRKSNLPPATIAGEIKAERVTDGKQQSDWPAVAVTADGAAWVTWIEWNGKDADRVLLSRRPAGGAWAKPLALDDGCWDHYAPAIAARGNDVVVVWSGQRERDGNYELYSAQVAASGLSGKVEQLTRSPHGDFNARMAADRNGNVTLVWQSFRDGNGDVFARQLRDGAWGPEIRVSPSDTNDWEPSVAVDSAGRAWISWDSYTNGNYDVLLRSLDGGRLGEVIAVTTEPTAQFHSTVAVDRNDRVWIAWDEDSENWGKDFSRSGAAPGSKGLHFSRVLGVRVFEGDRLRAPAADVAKVMTGRMTRYAELPQLAVDGVGTLWLVFRHWTEAKPRELYDFYATRLEGDRWAVPWKLGNSSGRNSQSAGVALAPDGRLLVAYSSDGRSDTVTPAGDQLHDLHYQVYVATLEKRAGSGAITLNEVKLPPALAAPPRRARYTMNVAGKTYTLLYGDCHRHTDIRGHSAVDGSILDTLRYARDAAQLDFMGFGDHNEVDGGRWADGLRDYTWWWSQKAIE